jgi:purine-cytosine permease-like protein
VRSAFQQVTALRTARLAGLLIIFAITTVLAETGYRTFLTSFENFINVLLFFFVPWSVINLIDYYIIKKGRYDVASFFSPPRSFYTGPLVKTLAGRWRGWC